MSFDSCAGKTRVSDTSLGAVGATAARASDADTSACSVLIKAASSLGPSGDGVVRADSKESPASVIALGAIDATSGDDPIEITAGDEGSGVAISSKLGRSVTVK